MRNERRRRAGEKGGGVVLVVVGGDEGAEKNQTAAAGPNWATLASMTERGVVVGWEGRGKGWVRCVVRGVMVRGWGVNISEEGRYETGGMRAGGKASQRGRKGTQQ